jgi:hypothetical protein
LKRWSIRSSCWSLALLAGITAACSDSSNLPAGSDTPGRPANASGCVADTAQIRALLTQSVNGAASLRLWSGILSSVNDLHDIPQAQQQVLSLDDKLLTANRSPNPPLPPAPLASLLNQLSCFVGLSSDVVDPNNAWVVHVVDPVKTFVTTDSNGGIQLPPTAVVTNTLVAAKPVPASTLGTQLDNYAAVYQWTLTPAQTLKPGMSATIGLCPDPTMLASLPPDQLDAIVGRLVLGHQATTDSFELLPRVPLPPGMELACPTAPAGQLHSSLGGRLLHSLASLFLPERANAMRRRGFVGGVGGSTTEFSPFGPVDPQLYMSGGVGGSATEFVRHGASLLSGDGNQIDGTVGTTRRGATMATVKITTFLGNPVSGIGVSFSTSGTAPAPQGNATVCGADPVTSELGVAALNCLFFGNTVQYHVAYTTLTANFSLPPSLADTAADGHSIVTITPSSQDWLVVAHGPSSLVFPQTTIIQPSQGRAGYPADGAVPTRVEIRSDLGEVVPNATNTITMTLNKNTLVGGASTISMAAVAGVANFASHVPTVATGYSFTAFANLADLGVVHSGGSSALFDIFAGNAAAVAATGTTGYGSTLVAGNVVQPQPTVLVTDIFGNPRPGTLVYWTPTGAAGASANGSTGQSTTATGADGRATALWTPANGANTLRASLQPAPGGAEVIFSGSTPSGP